MISVCIPIYNVDVTKLVTTLADQLKLLDIPSEIILIDDCSNASIKKLNESVCSKETYIKLENNIGRAAIRNRFLDYANYNYMLFMDCDMVVPDDDFLSKYLMAIKEYPNNLICGGLRYEAQPPKRAQKLRWKYGMKREAKTAEERNRNPNKSFMSSNFMIKKNILATIRFDERLVQYGHEDTLFGFELKKRNMTIVHIDNPILSVDLIGNEDFISNNEKAVENLIQILEFIGYEKDFIVEMPILRTHYNWYNFRIFILGVFLICRPIIKYFLSKGYVSLLAFDFYKLGMLTLKMRTAQGKNFVI